MGKLYNNKSSRYALIICLGVALLFVQTFKLHWHIKHDGISSSTTAGHIVDVHVASSLHDTMYDTHHQNNAQDHHHTAEIDVSFSSFVKKTGLLNPFVLLFSIISFILCVPRLHRIRWWYALKTKLPTFDYLLHPPLRAPPV
jgi:hypothetical protein